MASFLVRYKRIDLILRAFNAMARRRVDGQQVRDVKPKAGPKISFAGHLPAPHSWTQSRRQQLSFLLAARISDIVMAEAQACGTPVIAFNRGGARDIVRTADDSENLTGLLFDQQIMETIIDAVEEFEASGDRITPRPAAKM